MSEYRCDKPDCPICKFRAFQQSPEYIAWQSSIPQGLSMQEYAEWVTANPAPQMPEPPSETVPEGPSETVPEAPPTEDISGNPLPEPEPTP